LISSFRVLFVFNSDKRKKERDKYRKENENVAVNKLIVLFVLDVPIPSEDRTGTRTQNIVYAHKLR
jgi:hypothetical protein